MFGVSTVICTHCGDLIYFYFSRVAKTVQAKCLGCFMHFKEVILKTEIYNTIFETPDYKRV